jgi:hypothetical protein
MRRWIAVLGWENKIFGPPTGLQVSGIEVGWRIEIERIGRVEVTRIGELQTSWLRFD